MNTPMALTKALIVAAVSILFGFCMASTTLPVAGFVLLATIGGLVMGVAFDAMFKESIAMLTFSGIPTGLLIKWALLMGGMNAVAIMIFVAVCVAGHITYAVKKFNKYGY